jgi:hypothetical protein
MPVARRASPFLVCQLGILGPEAVEAFVKRFKVPISSYDITGLAPLTRLNSRALVSEWLSLKHDYTVETLHGLTDMVHTLPHQ